MKQAKKLLALLLAMVLCAGLFAGCGSGDSGKDSQTSPSDSQAPSDSSSPSDSASPSDSQTPAGTYENKVILGDTTEMSGDFRSPGWGGSSAGASDQAIWFLTVGYATMESDQGGAYQWNQTSVKSHDMVENDDGTATFTVTINEGLTYSDGTPITAKDYLVELLAFSSPICVEAGRPGTTGQSFLGFEDFNAYTGPDSAEGKKEFAGVRLIDDYTFELTVSSDYYPYYFAYTYAALQPAPLGLWLGEGVDIVDDGEGCYLTDSFYEKNGDSYVKAKEMADNRYDYTKYPYSGPYTITEWDAGTKQATLTINPAYQGNFEGQKPSIETVVYTKIISETQLEQLTSGGVDVLSGVTGGDDTKAALAVVDGEKFNETHYQRAGYGNIRFDCDFGPTMFQEVRQALTYLLNRTEFCQTFTGGYGVVVDGPYSPDFTMWQAVKDDIELIDYSFSPDTAKKVLEDGGWVYNSKGEAYVEGASGVDSVRYKKLTAEEAEGWGDAAGVNKTYKSVANTDGVTYQTVEINGEYYMPLAINWFGSSPNDVTDLLTTMLANSSDLAAAGMVIRPTTGDFNPTMLGQIYREPTYGYEGTPTYGMYNMADGWNSAIYDYAFNWSWDQKYFGYSVNKLYDPYDKDFPYDQKAEKLSYEEAMKASGGKLGMDYLSMAMVYNAETEDEYNEWWMAYIERWNQLMPAIPLYSNYYYDVYNAKIENFHTSPFFDQRRAIIYANIKGY